MNQSVPQLPNVRAVATFWTVRIARSPRKDLGRTFVLRIRRPRARMCIPDGATSVPWGCGGWDAAD